MASVGWLQGVRAGLILRNRTRTIGIPVPTDLGSRDLARSERTSRGWRWRGMHGQMARKEEAEDEERVVDPGWGTSDLRGGAIPADSSTGQATWNGNGIHRLANDNPPKSTRAAFETSLSNIPLDMRRPSSSTLPILKPPDPPSPPSEEIRGKTIGTVGEAGTDEASSSVDVSTSMTVLEEDVKMSTGTSSNCSESEGRRPNGRPDPIATDESRDLFQDRSKGAEKGSRLEDSLEGQASPAIRAARLVIKALDPATYAPSSSSTSVQSSTVLTIFECLHDEYLGSIMNVRQNGRARDLLPGQTIPPSLQASLDLQDSLRAVRRPRRMEMYETLINHCVIARRPDLAATVYVGLVEEWIMEGRLAEGGNPEEFREGGGPVTLAMSEEEEERVKIRYSVAAEVNGWFEGVRSWRFPGEKLTPSQRLDLWHPRKLALHEKLKGFPVPSPTSPPTLVPQPNLDCLKRVLAGVRLDGHEEDPLFYQRSARALATLANTVLSRTLPIMGLGCLLDAFRLMHYSQPEVYPEGFAPPEDGSDTYPYTAYAHTYRALMSLTLTPPTFSGTAVKSGFAALYRLPPLNTKTCNRLIHWVMTVVKQPALRFPLFDYMSRKGPGLARLNTVTYNTVFRGATLLRDNALAEEIRTVLFGPPGQKMPRAVEIPLVKDGVSLGGFFETNASAGAPREDERILPDAYSVSTNVAHLSVTNRFEEIIAIAYELYPFLDTDKYPMLTASATEAQIEAERARRAELSTSVARHSAHTFSACLHAFRRCGFVNLAGRLYQLGRRCEADASNNWRMPIQAYTTMMDLYADVKNRAAFNGRQTIRRERARKVFRDAFQAIGIREINETERRFNKERRATSSARPIPDLRFFEAFLRNVKLGPPALGDGDPQTDAELARIATHSSIGLFELEMVIHAATVWDLDIPDAWRQNEAYLRAGVTAIEAERERRLALASKGQDPSEAWKMEGLPSGFKLGALVRITEAWLWPEFRRSLDEFLPADFASGSRTHNSLRKADRDLMARRGM